MNARAAVVERVLVVGCLTLATFAREMRPLLPADPAAPVAVRLPPEPTEAERWAATELASALSNMAHRTTLVVTADSAQPAQIELAYDASLAPEAYVLEWTSTAFRIRGGRPRGVLYGVVGLLSDHLGCRWYTREVRHLPHQPVPALPSDLAEHGQPAFEYREVFWQEAFDGDWAAHNRLNSYGARLGAQHGGKVVYHPFVHTFEAILSPAQHFDAHPEWFSMVGGRRIRERTQLCLTNPEVRRRAVEAVRRWIRERPEVNIVSVSQNDWGNPCQCPECAALDAAEGSHAGSLLAFVNYVAENIEREFPQVRIDTLAYQYTRRPPRNLRPRSNVIVRLCSIECCFAHPLDSCTEADNRSFLEDLHGWSRICTNLYVWDYTTDFAHYLSPFPNLDVLGPNLRAFASAGVRGVFEQGNYQSPCGDLSELKAWVLAQLLWDPRRDADALIREFVANVYGKAAPHVQAYLDYRSRTVQNAGVHVRIYDGPRRADLAADALATWDDLLQRAEAAAADDPDLARRIERLRMPVWYAIVHGEGPRERRAVSARRLAEAIQRQQVTHLREGQGHIDRELSWLAVEAQRALAPTPTGVIRGEDSELSVAFLGQLAERVLDPGAEDSVAVRAVGSTREWLIQWRPTRAVSGHLYRVRARVRVELAAEPPADRPAFSLGVYDTVARRSLGSRTWTVAESCADRYANYELPPLAWSRSAYVWLAPSGDSNTVRAVYVDRFELE